MVLASYPIPAAQNLVRAPYSSFAPASNHNLPANLWIRICADPRITGRVIRAFAKARLPGRDADVAHVRRLFALARARPFAAKSNGHDGHRRTGSELRRRPATLPRTFELPIFKEQLSIGPLPPFHPTEFENPFLSDAIVSILVLVFAFDCVTHSLTNKPTSNTAGNAAGSRT